MMLMAERRLSRPTVPMSTPSITMAPAVGDSTRRNRLTIKLDLPEKENNTHSKQTRDKQRERNN
jgi:hypothetical protein